PNRAEVGTCSMAVSMSGVWLRRLKLLQAPRRSGTRLTLVLAHQRPKPASDKTSPATHARPGAGMSEEEKAAHHPRVVGVLFRPSVVFAKDGSSCPRRHLNKRNRAPGLPA